MVESGELGPKHNVCKIIFFLHSVKVAIYISDVYLYIWEKYISINNNRPPYFR